MKLLCDNPNALVKFHNVVGRTTNPKYEHLNDTQRKRLHQIKYRLAKYQPPMDYIANNIVESKFFKKMINYIIYINLFTVLFQTSLTTEYKLDHTDVPADINWLILSDESYPASTRKDFKSYLLDQGDTFDQQKCQLTRSDSTVITLNDTTSNTIDWEECYKEANDDWKGWGSSTSGCADFFGHFKNDIVIEALDAIFVPFEMIIMAIFILEVILYWIDDFKAYWRSSTRIFDFFITLLCILPPIFDHIMDKRLKSLSTVKSTIDDQSKCQYILYGNNTLIDISARFNQKRYSDNLLFTILYQYDLPRGQKSFIGGIRERFCNVMEDPDYRPKHLTRWDNYWESYFCTISSTNQISGFLLLSYNFILALRVCRIFKITLAHEKVLAIVISIKKAIKSMWLIMVVFATFLTVFSLLIYTMFNDSGETFGNGPSYTFENFEEWIQTPGKAELDVSLLPLCLCDKSPFQKRYGFAGFITFMWTFAILFQLMTLDRWKGIMDQLHTDTFNITFCELHTTPTVMGWMKNGFFGDGAYPDDKMKWFIWLSIILFVFAWIWFGNFVFKNLVTGVVVNTHLAQR